MFDWLRRPGSSAPAGAVTRDLHGDDWHIQLDLTPQVLSLAIPEETTWEDGEDELAPTSAGLSDRFISASTLAIEAKLFDDGLYAAAELATLWATAIPARFGPRRETGFG